MKALRGVITPKFPMATAEPAKPREVVKDGVDVVTGKDETNKPKFHSILSKTYWLGANTHSNHTGMAWAGSVYLCKPPTLIPYS